MVIKRNPYFVARMFYKYFLFHYYKKNHSLKVTCGIFQKHLLFVKGAFCSNTQKQKFKCFLVFSIDVLISIPCCLLKVSTGSVFFILILSFYSLCSSHQTTEICTCSKSVILCFFVFPFPFPLSNSEQLDRVEVFWLTCGCGDQCHGGSHGPDSPGR